MHNLTDAMALPAAWQHLVRTLGLAKPPLLHCDDIAVHPGIWDSMIRGLGRIKKLVYTSYVYNSTLNLVFANGQWSGGTIYQGPFSPVTPAASFEQCLSVSDSRCTGCNWKLGEVHIYTHRNYSQVLLYCNQDSFGNSHCSFIAETMLTSDVQPILDHIQSQMMENVMLWP